MTSKSAMSDDVCNLGSLNCSIDPKKLLEDKDVWGTNNCDDDMCQIDNDDFTRTEAEPNSCFSDLSPKVHSYIYILFCGNILYDHPILKPCNLLVSVFTRNRIASIKMSFQGIRLPDLMELKSQTKRI